MRKILRISTLLAIGLLMPLMIFADEFGSIRGVVTDPSGAVIAGVKLTATNVATGISASVTSKADGSYGFLNIHTPATYNLTAEQSGFKTFEAKGIPLALNQIYILNVTMELGPVTQHVTVEAAPAQVETTTMQLGANINSTVIDEMPLNGRDWVTLQQTLPGVMASSDRFTYNFSTNGARTQANGFMINGTDANDLPLNTPLQIPSPDAISEVHMITNTINPEYGRNSGAIMNAVTKAGSNAFHGDGFEFYRDTSLNTRNFFSLTPEVFHQNQFGGTFGGPIKKDKAFFFFSYQGTRARQPDGVGDTPVYTADQFPGGNFPSIATSSTLSPFPLTGDNGTVYPAGTPYSTIFPNGTIPAADFSSISTGLVQKYVPPPNSPDGKEFLFNPISVASTNQEIARVDENLTAHDSIWGYGYWSRSPSMDGLPFIGANLPGFAETGQRNIYQYTLAWNHTFSGNALNEARFGYNRFNFVAVEPATPELPSAAGFTGITPQDPAHAGLPVISVLGFFTLGFSEDGPQPRIDQTYQATDNFSYIHGTHTFKMGFETRRAQVFNPFDFLNSGEFGYSGEGAYSTGNPGADFLLGIPDYYAQSSGGLINARTQEYYSYFQDQWKARRNLTFTYGVAWQVDTPQTDIYNGSVAINCFRPGEQSTVFPTAPVGLVFPGDSSCSASGYHTHYDHLGPRAGFAWSPGSNNKWSLRGGFGIYYNVPEEELTLQNLLAPPFALIDYGIGDVGGPPSFAAPYTSICTALTLTCTVTGSIPNKYPFSPPAKGAAVNFPFYYPFSLNVLDPNFTIPSSYNYNLTLERELPAAMILTVGYVGLQGRHLENTVELNPAGQFPGENPVAAAANCGTYYLYTCAAADSTFPYNPDIFGSVGQQQTDANSNYNALQVSVNKHMSHGLQFQAAYTWSHSLDFGSSFENSEGLQNPFARYTSYGDSAFDARQRFVFSYVYQLPAARHNQGLLSRLTDGWEIAGITTLQTGFPVSLSDSSLNSLTCNYPTSFYGCWDRPNIVGPVQIADPRSNTQTYTYGVNSLGGSASLPNYWFNPNSFTPEAYGGPVGDAGRNFFHASGINNFDFSIHKNVHIDEARYFQLRFEFFNFFNHTQFAGPDSNVSDPNFGRIFGVSGVNPSRLIQLAGKFYF